jgi:hypothetical protein
VLRNLGLAEYVLKLFCNKLFSFMVFLAEVFSLKLDCSFACKTVEYLKSFFF